MALTVYDLADPGDLARGRTIAGTGSIDLAGNVGPVGRLRQKLLAAKAARATVFLAPGDQAAEPRRVAGNDMAVKPLRTLAEAVDARSVR